MSAPRAAAQLLRIFECQSHSNIRSDRYYAGGDGAARHPYHRAKHIPTVKWRHLSLSANQPPRHRGGYGSRPQCTAKMAWRLSMNHHSQIRITNDETQRNAE